MSNDISKSQNEEDANEQQKDGTKEIVTDDEMWNHKLEQNEAARRRDSKYFNLEPGEEADVEFVEILGPVQKDFDGDGRPDQIRYEYRVRDLNDLAAGIKTWSLSKTWSENIDFLLKQSHRSIHAVRKGSGMQTKYYFSPINTQRMR